MHGGTAPSGFASPNFKTGRWSKHLPLVSLGQKFKEAYQDRTLMQLRQDTALVDAMITSYTASLRDTGRPLTLKQQERVLALVEQRRKLVESEARRLRDLALVVPVEQYLNALMQLSALMRSYLVDNPVALDELAAASRRILTGKGPVIEGQVVEGGE